MPEVRLITPITRQSTKKMQVAALTNSSAKRSIWLAMVTLYSVPKTSISWLLEMF